MPRDIAVFDPPALPYSGAVASLFGRHAVSFTAAGTPGRAWLRAPRTTRKQSKRDPGHRLSFRVDGVDGTLAVPASLADTLLRAAEPAPLGLHDPSTAALLLEFALADALDVLEAVAGGAVEFLAFGPDTGMPPDAGIKVGVEGELGDAAFAATLTLNPTLFERMRALVTMKLPPERPVPAPPVLLGIRVGIAQLPVSTVESLAAGDAVIPDVLLAAHGALLVFGERFAARARLDGKRLVLDNAPAPITAEWREWIVSSDQADEGGDPAAIVPREAGLDELQVILVFELGRRTLPMAEVVGLAAGHVIELGPVEGAAVSVLANGARLGRGEMVRVGDTLAVRLTQLGTGR